MLAETICSAVAAAGLGIAAVTAYRRRFLAAARIAAYSLVPLGLVLTGAVEWAVDTAFSPSAWVGFGLLGGAWLLFAATRVTERRRAAKAVPPAAEPAPRSGAVAPGATAPSLGSGGETRGRPRRKETAEDDFSDIEAILKKHGI
ncbi:hypothetical protein ACRAR1_24975 [Streptomyces sanyensis]|uniref:hypothetical protein n=1 Tax=Streptomyces sanyensis TaxID=568869 RepID=UPI003D77808A